MALVILRGLASRKKRDAHPHRMAQRQKRKKMPLAKTCTKAILIQTATNTDTHVRPRITPPVGVVVIQRQYQ